MANHASHAALPYPIKGARFTLLVPYLDADGDPTDPTTPDTELSKDDAGAADAAEEIASPKNSVGMLTLSGAETDCSCISLAGKAASGPKTTLGTIYPRVLAVVGTGTLSAASAGGGTLGTLLAYDVTGCFIKTTGGTGGGGTGGANNQARKIITYNTGTGAFTVEPNWETTPSTDTTYAVLLPEGVTLGMLQAINPATPGRKPVVDAAGLIDANAVKLGPSGFGTAQTARDVGASVLVGDKSGFSLSAGGIQSIWDALTSALTTSGSIGKRLADNVDAAITSRSSHAAADIWSVGTRLLTAGTNIVLAKGTGVTGFNDPTLQSIIDGVVEEDLSAHLPAANSLAEKVLNTNSTATSIQESIDLISENTVVGEGVVVAGGAPTTTAFRTDLTQADNWWADALIVWDQSASLAGQSKPILSYAQANGLVTVSEAFTSAPQVGDRFTIRASHIHPVSQIAGSVWDEATAGHSTADTFGKAVSDILSDTNELQADWANGGRLDLILDSTLADTNELQQDWVNGGRLDLILDARASQVSVDTIDDLIDTEIGDLATSVAAISSALAVVDGNVDAILLDTGTDGVALSAAAVDAIHDEPITEPVARPAWSSMTHRKIQQTLGVLMLNEVDSDANSVDVRNDADSATLWSYPSSDDGTTYISGKAA